MNPVGILKENITVIIKKPIDLNINFKVVSRTQNKSCYCRTCNIVCMYVCIV